MRRCRPDVAVAVSGAQSFDPVSIAALIGNPTAHADKHVVVEGRPLDAFLVRL